MSKFTQITPEQAKTMLEEGNVNVADIRDAMSYGSGHIAGAKRVDNSNLREFMAAADASAPLIVCCYHGNSSQGAAQFFAEQGYSQAYSLIGGYERWKLMHPELCERG
ncbi:thiosulfate sulfurtransferase GlpE [Oceanobacter mangrovi]|uniref:thiosulfate sulfurtransferase GlpE n=1 Tax=Oceanobacter mangrovi TaxID=2862510 RepID=UPI001C8E0434|nr:thiosulfate sulfurtransferase GlpE [Oceanobacter mangrovi]